MPLEPLPSGRLIAGANQDRPWWSKLVHRVPRSSLRFQNGTRNPLLTKGNFCLLFG